MKALIFSRMTEYVLLMKAIFCRWPSSVEVCKSGRGWNNLCCMVLLHQDIVGGDKPFANLLHCYHYICRTRMDLRFLQVPLSSARQQIWKPFWGVLMMTWTLWTRPHIQRQIVKRQKIIQHSPAVIKCSICTKNNLLP